jgi:Gluconate 2-dehydrogenase subunit 3
MDTELCDTRTDVNRQRDPLLCLTDDEAAFIDAAFVRVLGADGSGSSGSAYVDSKLWQSDCFRAGSDGGRKAAYRARIGDAQERAVHVYGRRFQHLRGEQQDALLALLEAGDASAEISGRNMLTALLVSDAAEAYFS